MAQYREKGLKGSYTRYEYWKLFQLITDKKELEALKAVFDTAIKAVTDTEHHDILAKRYLEFKDWNQIAEEMGYSKPSCYRLHREALAGMKS